MSDHHSHDQSFHTYNDNHHDLDNTTHNHNNTTITSPSLSSSLSTTSTITTQNNNNNNSMLAQLLDFRTVEEQLHNNTIQSIERLKKALELNKQYQTVLDQRLNRIENSQQKNRSLQRRLKTMLMDKKSAENDLIDSTSGKVRVAKPVNSKKYMNIMQKRPAIRYFFQDRQGVYPPPNSDTLQKKVHQEKMPLVYKNKKWSPIDVKNLKSGVRQQLQQKMMAKVMTRFQNDTSADAVARLHTESQKIEKMTDQQLEMAEYKQDPDAASNLQRIYKEIEENGANREDLLNIDWTNLCSEFLPNRTPEEAKKYWLSTCSCKVKADKWTRDEDRLILALAQQYKGHNWIEIAQNLHEKKLQNPNFVDDGTYRTPLHCFRRYQRSLNVNMMKSKWSAEEDEALKFAVEQYGEKNWQQVANCLEGRAGQQCLHRWMKTLSPFIKRGRWTMEEDKRLIMGVHAYGKSWITIHEHIPGRTDVQCRERWCNILNPEVNAGPWTTEEDDRLRRAIAEYGLGKWSKISELCRPRTDNQCWRRWKVLNSEKEVREYKKTLMKRQNGLVRNFVGREKERSLLTEDDFEIDEGPEKVDSMTIMDDEMNDELEREQMEQDDQQQPDQITADQNDKGKKKRGPKKGSTRGPIRRTKGHTYRLPVHPYVRSIISYPALKSLLPLLKLELFRQKQFHELTKSKKMLVGVQPSTFVNKAISLLQLSHNKGKQIAFDKDTKFAFVDPIIVTPDLVELPCMNVSRVTISALAALHDNIFEDTGDASASTQQQPGPTITVENANTLAPATEVQSAASSSSSPTTSQNTSETTTTDANSEASASSSNATLHARTETSSAMNDIQRRIKPRFGVDQLQHLDPEILETSQFKTLTSVFNSLFQHSLYRVMYTASSMQKPQRLVVPELTAHLQHLVPKKDKPQGATLARQHVGLYHIYKNHPEPFEILFDPQKKAAVVESQPPPPAPNGPKKRGRPRKYPLPPPTATESESDATTSASQSAMDSTQLPEDERIDEPPKKRRRRATTDVSRADSQSIESTPNESAPEVDGSSHSMATETTSTLDASQSTSTESSPTQQRSERTATSNTRANKSSESVQSTSDQMEIDD